MCNFTAIAMATFTFRIPDSVTGRLSSAQMRSWLADFLRQPHALPADPGSGEERISLTLPNEAVSDAASFLRCSPSCALRRVAAERLGNLCCSGPKNGFCTPRNATERHFKDAPDPGTTVSRELWYRQSIERRMRTSAVNSAGRSQLSEYCPNEGAGSGLPNHSGPVHLEVTRARIPGAEGQKNSASALLLSIIPGLVLLVVLFFVFRRVRENAIAA
jgi:hypothetical protein